ncbi:MAG: site-specific integrase [Desulfovibrio sp.]|nr:site-specific integrase [Desulfovibrio sp.]
MQKRLDSDELERVYYIRYRRGGRGTKEIEEPVGRESEHMTAAKANKIRVSRMVGDERSNTEQRRDAEAERQKADEPLTLGRLWEIYSEFEKAKPIFKSDLSRINYLSPLLNRKIESLETRDIDALTRRLLSTPRQNRKESACLSPQTVKHILGLLKRILHFADRQSLCTFPAALKITMPKVDNEKTESMSAAQLDAYWKALDEEPDQNAAALLRLALLTGMRKGALLALQWSDIDFEHGHITLRGETAKKGKTEHIPLSASAKVVLEKVQRTESPYVFPGRDGGKREDFRRMARRVRDKAGLPEDFRPLHGLRHSFASYLASSGKVDLYALQKLLTHESPEMTQRYAHLADEAMKRAASVADGMVGLKTRDIREY